MMQTALSTADTKQALKKIEKDLEAYHAAAQIAPMDLVLTEQAVAKQMMAQANRNWNTQEKSANSLLSFTATETWASSLTLVFAPPFVVFFLMSVLGLPMGIASGIGGLACVANAFLMCYMLFGADINPYISVRNRVILRKRFQREVRVTTQKNIQNAERYAKLLDGKEKKLARAQQTVEMLAEQYEQKNPGRTLQLSQELDAVVEVAKPTAPVPAARNKKELVGRIADQTPKDDANDD